MSELRGLQLLIGGISAKTATYPSGVYCQLAKLVGQGKEGHITTYSEEDGQDVPLCSSTSSSRSLTCSAAR